jgi:t-SNARE complex subunit (syntaxin)
LFEHQLKAWGETFCSATAPESREARTALRELQVKHDGLQRELRRKEKALAEAAALLVLAEKSSRPCGRTRRNNQLPTTSDNSDADRAVLRLRRTSAKGLRPD